jgi:membrane protease YdiL (CAAX protease family)
MTSLPAPPHPSPPERPEAPDGVTRASQAPPWPAWTSVAALIAGFGAATFTAILIGGVGAVFGASIAHPPPAVSLASLAAQDACLIGAALLFARMVAPPRPWHFGLRPTRPKPAIAYTVAGYLAFIVISYLWLVVIGRPDEKDTVIKDIGADRSTIALIGATFLVTVCAPLSEEFFFRGYFFGALRGMGLWPAAILTGLAFGLVHVFGSPIAFLVPLALLGIGLCLLRERTGSLYPGIALHCLNNSLAMASSQHWSWQIPVVVVGAPLCIALLIWLGLRVWGPEPAGMGAPAPAPLTA